MIEPEVLEIWKRQVKDYSIRLLEDWLSRDKADVTLLWGKMVKKEYDERKKKMREKVRFD